MGQLDALQECAGGIDADQGNAIMVEFLEGLDAAAASTFTLRGVDDLPGLIVFLFAAIAGFSEVKDDGEQDGEDAQIFENFEERPAAEKVGRPFQYPFKSAEGEGDGKAILAVSGPGGWPGAEFSDQHGTSDLSTVR